MGASLLALAKCIYIKIKVFFLIPKALECRGGSGRGGPLNRVRLKKGLSRRQAYLGYKGVPWTSKEPPPPPPLRSAAVMASNHEP